MGGDYTRLRFNPANNGSSLRMQQGKVMLDADWNELAETLDRRARVGLMDVIGPAAAPSTTTPGGFQITIAAGKPTVGVGRLYVDGLIAENHGDFDGATLAFEPHTGELVGIAPTPVDKQPFWPGFDITTDLPAPPYLAYADVWEREVTALEDPSLIDPAVGVDTAIAVRTVWQIRFLPGLTAVDPNNPPQAWKDATQPSAGRLSTRAIGIPAPTDPCVLPLTGGYRGFENRLYRVEIHEPGSATGTGATFKWSRDNGSVAVRVLSIENRTTLHVDPSGRNMVRRFAAGDLVEVTSERQELLGLPGLLTTVQGTPDDTRMTVTVADDALIQAAIANLPAGHDPNLRLRRWDGRGAVPQPGPPTMGVFPLTSEGIQLTFGLDPSSGSFKAGDHWVFAARTADASIEALKAAPPRGPQHHYAMLGIVTSLGPPPIVKDLRTTWPPSACAACECNEFVSADEHNSSVQGRTVQDAVNRLMGRGPVPGGKVCLGPGVFTLKTPLNLRGVHSLQLEGRGWATVLSYEVDDQPVLVVDSAVDVTLEDLVVVGSGPSAESGVAVSVSNSIAVTVKRCGLFHVAPASLDQFLGLVRTGGKLADLRNALGQVFADARGVAVRVTGAVPWLQIRECTLVGGTGVSNSAGTGVPGPAPPGPLQPQPGDLSQQLLDALGNPAIATMQLRIEDNTIVGTDLGGIVFTGVAVHVGETRIRGNVITGLGQPDPRGIVSWRGIGVDGLSDPGFGLGLLHAVNIDGNLVSLQGIDIDSFGDAISVSCGPVRITNNDVIVPGVLESGLVNPQVPPPTGPPPKPTDSVAYFAAYNPGTPTFVFAGGTAIHLGTGASDLVADCEISGNRILGVPGEGISIDTPLLSASIRHNLIAGTGQSGISMQANSSADVLEIENNRLIGIGPKFNLVGSQPGARGAVLGGEIVGMDLQQVTNVVVGRNTIVGVGATAVNSHHIIGIRVAGCPSALIRENVVLDVGPPGLFNPGGAGHAIIISGGEKADVSSNTVLRKQSKTPADLDSPWTALSIENAVTVVVRHNEFGGSGLREMAFITGTVSTSVTDNHWTWESKSTDPIIHIQAVAGSPLIMQGNLVEISSGPHLGPVNAPPLPPGNQLRAVVLLVARLYTVLGNITIGGQIMVIEDGLLPFALPVPWFALNINQGVVGQ